MKKCSVQRDNEKGDVIVEATMIFPIVILSVLALFFATLFMAQKANLQANLQNALLYYKNSESDTFVKTLDEVKNNRGDGSYGAIGNEYVVPVKMTVEWETMSPYRFLWTQFDENQFKEYFLESCNNMFFYDGTNVSVETKCTNWVVYKKISATATQTMIIPIDTRFIGIDPEVEIEASAEVVIMDGDNFVRSIDMVSYMYEQTDLSDKVNSIIEKGKSFYDKFKEFFGVNGK